jgi:hypothetical protein
MKEIMQIPGRVLSFIQISDAAVPNGEGHHGTS